MITNEEVEVVDSYRYLDVKIDNQLNWYEHSSLFLSKLNQRMFFLRKQNCSIVTVNIIYHAYSSLKIAVLTLI